MATTISAQSLTDHQKHLATIAALEAQGDLVRLEPAITAALDGGVTINEIKEAFSQLYAYTGFPRSLNALGVLSQPLRCTDRRYLLRRLDLRRQQAESGGCTHPADQRDHRHYRVLYFDLHHLQLSEEF